MFTAILILALGADPAFVPSPEFLERWKTMPATTPAEIAEREEVRKEWLRAGKIEHVKQVSAARQQRAAQKSADRKKRVEWKNSTGYHFRLQAENNAAVARGLNSLQPRQYYYVP